MTEHERACFNAALHKGQMQEAELRIRRKLDLALFRLHGLKTADQVPFLKRLEEGIVEP